ncbi:MAG: hypothetical protein AB7K09_23275 [Planctomycetota bacterium]
MSTEPALSTVPATLPDPGADRARLMRSPAILLGLGALFVLACAGLSVAVPLIVYTGTLAVFGLAHVLAELRYVDSRFSPRVGWNLRIGLIVMLAAVVIVRVLHAAGTLDSLVRVVIELSLVAGLGAIVLPVLFRRGVRIGLIGVLVVGVIGTGAVLAPFHTLLALAVLHNMTPVGFLAERLRGAVRRGVMALCILVFVLLPMLIASGLPLEYFRFLGLHHPDLYLFFSAGSLDANIGQYVPAEVQRMDPDLALSFFAAAVFLQCMHYFVVIHILPRLDSDGEWITPVNTVAWPRRGLFTLVLVATASVLLLFFWYAFGQARTAYGLIAAVHAWVEIPLLLLAMALPIEMFRRSNPDRTDEAEEATPAAPA